MHTDLNIQQEGQIIPRKCLNRCLCSSNNINIQVRLEKRVTINCNRIAPSYTHQEHHRNRFETGFMTDINIFLNSSKKMCKRDIITSSVQQQTKDFVSFATLKHLYNREKQRLNRRNMNDIDPPNEMTHICKEDLYSDPQT